MLLALEVCTYVIGIISVYICYVHYKYVHMLLV